MTVLSYLLLHAWLWACAVERALWDWHADHGRTGALIAAAEARRKT